jgi:stage IV sporulation protein FB
MLGIPERTRYDLTFPLLGFPIRIHPLFWLVTVVLGWDAGGAFDLDPNQGRVLWVLCVLVSILVHELGHGVAARGFGARPAILLHGMGGLCVYDPSEQTAAQRFIVLICGPGAGFVLAAAVLVIARSAYGMTPTDFLTLLGWWRGGRTPGLERFLDANAQRAFLVWSLFFINLLWGLLNLLPIYPLDGGQMTGVVLSAVKPGEGARWTHMISIGVAGLVALYAAMNRNWFNALFFAYFAGFNMQALQALRADPWGGDRRGY